MDEETHNDTNTKNAGVEPAQGLLIYLNIFVYVTVIKRLKIELTNQITIKKRKRMIFIADLASIYESNYLNRAKSGYNDCSCILLNTGEELKVEESFEDLSNLMLYWWQTQQESEGKNNK